MTHCELTVTLVMEDSVIFLCALYDLTHFIKINRIFNAPFYPYGKRSQCIRYHF